MKKILTKFSSDLKIEILEFQEMFYTFKSHENCQWVFFWRTTHEFGLSFLVTRISNPNAA